MIPTIISKEVTVVFKGGAGAVKGRVLGADDHRFALKGKPSGVVDPPSLHVIPWTGVAYVRVHPEPVDQ